MMLKKADGASYARVKVRGKQFKAGLKTDNLAEARRKLKDFRNDMGRVESRGKSHPRA